MPIYVYKFVDTGETIEVEQSFTDATLTKYKHPQTGKKMAVKKVFQPVGVTFKGSGFYKTDSRAGAKKSSASKSESAKSESANSESTKSESATSTGDASKGGSASKSATASSTKSDSTATKKSAG